MGVGQIGAQYQELIRRLRSEGVDLSDRRLVKGLKLIRGAALLDGREEADARDLWPLNHIWSNPEDVSILREVIQPIVADAGGPDLDTHRPLDELKDEPTSKPFGFDSIRNKLLHLFFKICVRCFAERSALTVRLRFLRRSSVIPMTCFSAGFATPACHWNGR